MATAGGSPGKLEWNDFHKPVFRPRLPFVRAWPRAEWCLPNEENDMKRIAAYLASAALGAVLVGSSPAWAQMRGDIAWRGYPYNPDNYAYNYGYPYTYGYPYNYAYGYGYPSNYASGYPSSYAYGYGYPYANSYGYANPFAIVTAPIAALTAPVTAMTAEAAAAPFGAATSATAPLVTGRSVATGGMGKMCSTPVKACELYHASYIGNGCSCRVTGGRSRGTVSP
jgi:hypothetical protein